LHFVSGLLGGAEAKPLFAIDLSAGRAGLQLCREILERLNVPVVAVSPYPVISVDRGPQIPATVATEADLSQIFRAFAFDPAGAEKAIKDQVTSTPYDKDAGWAYIWAFCKRLSDHTDSVFA
jgi:hypothetical protein